MKEEIDYRKIFNLKSGECRLASATMESSFSGVSAVNWNQFLAVEFGKKD